MRSTLSLLAFLLVLLTLSPTIFAEEEAPPVPEAPYPGAPEVAEKVTTKSDDVEEPAKTPAKKEPYKRHKPRPAVFRISEKGEYYYPRFSSPQSKAASLKIGSFGAPSLKNESTNLTFNDIYKSSGIMVLFDYEWQFMKSLGKLGFKVGSGIYTASGQGRFKSGGTARETYNLYMFPNNVSLIYRFHYKDKQPIVPYVEGGGGYFGFTELRSDNKKTKFGGAGVAMWAAGFNILLDRLDPSTMAELDVDMGINHLYLTGELRSFIGLNKTLDFSSTMMNAGFTFEF